MSTQIYDLIDLNQSKSGLCIRINNHYTNRAFRAEDEVRTRDPQLGRLMLYRLSYFRNLVPFSKRLQRYNFLRYALQVVDNFLGFLCRNW